MLLDGGASTVEDQDEVKCVRVVIASSLVIGQCIHSSESLVVFAPMVGRDDSIVVGILRRSPVSGERVGERVQSRSVSEGQGTSYSISCPYFIIKNGLQATFSVHVHWI